MFTRLLFLSAFIFVTLFFSPVYAHTTLLSSLPVDGQLVKEKIHDLSLSFVGKIRLTKVSVNINGQRLGNLDLSKHKDFSKQFLLPFPFTQEGQFQVIWRGLGEDGHVLTGMIQFKKI